MEPEKQLQGVIALGPTVCLLSDAQLEKINFGGPDCVGPNRNGDTYALQGRVIEVPPGALEHVEPTEVEKLAARKLRQLGKSETLQHMMEAHLRQQLLGQVAHCMRRVLLMDFPHLTPEQVQECVSHASEQMLQRARELSLGQVQQSADGSKSILAPIAPGAPLRGLSNEVLWVDEQNLSSPPSE